MCHTCHAHQDRTKSIRAHSTRHLNYDSNNIIRNARRENMLTKGVTEQHSTRGTDLCTYACAYSNTANIYSVCVRSFARIGRFIDVSVWRLALEKWRPHKLYIRWLSCAKATHAHFHLHTYFDRIWFSDAKALSCARAHCPSTRSIPFHFHRRVLRASAWHSHHSLEHTGTAISRFIDLGTGLIMKSPASQHATSTHCCRC